MSIPIGKKASARRDYEKHKEAYLSRARANYLKIRHTEEYKIRQREAVKRYRQKDPEKRKAMAGRANLKQLLKRHGMTLVEYEAMLHKQGGACAICGEKSTQRLSFDHNHSTGKVRGLLCTRCNFGIGHFRDNIGLLAEAAVYLTDTLEVMP